MKLNVAYGSRALMWLAAGLLTSGAVHAASALQAAQRAPNPRSSPTPVAQPQLGPCHSIVIQNKGVAVDLAAVATSPYSVTLTWSGFAGAYEVSSSGPGAPFRGSAMLGSVTHTRKSSSTIEGFKHERFKQPAAPQLFPGSLTHAQVSPGSQYSYTIIGTLSDGTKACGQAVATTPPAEKSAHTRTLAPPVHRQSVEGGSVARLSAQTTSSVPVGPPPRGIRFESSATYGIFSKIAWDVAPNVTNYQVSRAKRDDSTCCNATSGLLPASTTSWGDVGLFKPGYYSYTITVTYADGSVGKGAIDLIVQQGAAPNPITVEDLAPGRVRIKWNVGVPGTCCVKITGPGFGAAGEKLVVGGGPVDLTLPTGTHSWTVASAYNAGNLPVAASTNYGVSTAYGGTYVVLAPPSEWARVSHTVNIRSERFRISLERFHSRVDVTEDLLRADGRGNEIYIATQVSEYGRNRSLLSTRMIRTPTFGDVHNYPTRIQAGSMSPNGGIRANDEYPAAVLHVSQLTTPSTTNLPYLLWEGDLSEADGAVILSPSIWEADEDDRLFRQFATFQTAAASGWPFRSYLSGYVPSATHTSVADTWRPTVGNDCTNSDQFRPQGSWGDEPIDMSRTLPYCPKYVAINWRLASSATRVNPAVVLEIPFFANVDSVPGQFKLFVRIEKVTPPPAVTSVK